ncbi:MAG TPA: SPOR domain-containing protein, partial [Geminicoccaceae bacterium]|nr:SPOR domain-containing protein [Geminicoccaceae bacterium]
AAPPAPATATAALPPRATAPAGRSAPAAGPIFRVQLGAFRSDAAAGQAWRVYQGRHPAVLGDLRASVVLADTSSGTFYRLQAGPLPSRDSAVRACNQIKSAGGDCFIVGPLP